MNVSCLRSLGPMHHTEARVSCKDNALKSQLASDLLQELLSDLWGKDLWPTNSLNLNSSNFRLWLKIWRFSVYYYVVGWLPQNSLFLGPLMSIKLIAATFILSVKYLKPCRRPKMGNWDIVSKFSLYFYLEYYLPMHLCARSSFICSYSDGVLISVFSGIADHPWICLGKKLSWNVVWTFH